MEGGNTPQARTPNSVGAGLYIAINRECKIDLKILTSAVRCPDGKKYRSLALGDN